MAGTSTCTSIVGVYTRYWCQICTNSLWNNVCNQVGNVYNHTYSSAHICTFLRTVMLGRGRSEQYEITNHKNSLRRTHQIFRLLSLSSRRQLHQPAICFLYWSYKKSGTNWCTEYGPNFWGGCAHIILEKQVANLRYQYSTIGVEVICWYKYDWYFWIKRQT